MKRLHISDLHIGKRVNEFSMLEDQAHILAQILDIAAEEQPDAVLIAGDVYDKTVPPAEAVELLDDFLFRLTELKKPVFIISGNHDSPERLAFGGRLMSGGGVYISPVYCGEVAPITLNDAFGAVNIWLLPFIKPSHVRRFYPEENIADYTQAVGCAIRHMPLDTGARNVLVTHQFVTGAARSESEELSIGGTDNVDASVFDGFDYVALGHIHGPQNISSPRIRYCGTPLKYSFSEARQHKSVTVAELGQKGKLEVKAVELTPLRDMAELRGSYDELTSRNFYAGSSWQEDYVHITLTDEDDIPDAVGKLRTIYHNLMKLDYDNMRTRGSAIISAGEAPEKKDPLTIFGEFYELQNNAPLSPAQETYMKALLEAVWEGEP